MKTILSLTLWVVCLSLITTGQAFSQQTPVKIYATGSGTNSNTGDPLATWAAKYNQNDFNLNLSGTASGTDTYAVTISAPSPGFYTGISAPSAYTSNARYFITFTNANTGPATLNINSIGAKDIKKAGNEALAANDIKAGGTYLLWYNGTYLQLIGGGGSTDLSSYATTSYVDSQDAGRQPIDGDLTAIAGLSPSNDDFIQRKSGAWTNRTVAQVKSDLGLTGTNSGDQTITLTGDVTGSGTGSFATTVSNTIKTREYGIACSDLTTALTTGTSKGYFRIPRGFTVTAVRASVLTAQTSGSVLTIDINESGTTILSTKLTIDNSEKTSTTAATAAVISDTSLADDAEITIDIDQVGSSPVGLIVWLIGY